jgi:hypothetical protein
MTSCDDASLDRFWLIDNDRAEKVRRHRRQLVRVPRRFQQLHVLNLPIDRLLDVVPEGPKPIVLGIVFGVAPYVRALIQRNGVAHGALEDALQRLGLSSHERRS